MKGLFASLTCLLFAFVLLPGSSAAQDQKPMVINGGVLNGKAVSLPKPPYPAEAKEAKAEGTVAVDVVIDENGIVTSAESQPYDAVAKKSEDGTTPEPIYLHPALRTAAETAALSARFSPTLLSGQPVKVKGQIIYTFAVGAVTGMEDDRAPGRGGLLNGAATSLPTPDYPAAALAVRASGAVNVQVTIDEEGNVVQAAAISGHPLLRSAAVDAARQAKFTPVKRKGEPVKVTGVIVYNFTPAVPEAKSSNR